VKGKETETEEAAELTPPGVAVSGEYYLCTYISSVLRLGEMMHSEIKATTERDTKKYGRNSRR